MSGKIKTLDDLTARIEAMDEEEEIVEREEDEVVTSEEEPVKEEPAEEPVKEESTEEEPAEEPVKEESTEEEPVKEEDVPEVEAFVPEKTYKSMGEEKEYDEFLLSAVKSPEQMEAVKRLYQKANGMEHYEKKNNALTQTNQNLISENENYKSEYGFYNKLMKEGQYHTLFRTINIPDEEILKVAQSILDYSELTPYQQSAYDNNIVNTQKVHNLEAQSQRLQETVDNSSSEAHIQELDAYLLNDSVINTVNGFDQRVGQIGAFKNEVIKQAAMIEKTTGKELSIEEAVNNVLRLTGPVSMNQPVQTQQEPVQVGNKVPSQQPSQPRVIVKNEVPTIPNLKAGNKSPAKKVVKSLDDLHKLAESLDDY